MQAALPSLMTCILKTMSPLESHSLEQHQLLTSIASASMGSWNVTLECLNHIFEAVSDVRVKCEFVLLTMTTTPCILGKSLHNWSTTIASGKTCWWFLEKGNWSRLRSRLCELEKCRADTWITANPVLKSASWPGFPLSSTLLLFGHRGGSLHISTISLNSFMLLLQVLILLEPQIPTCRMRIPPGVSIAAQHCPSSVPNGPL